MKLAVFLAGVFLAVVGLFFIFGSSSLAGLAAAAAFEIAAVVVFAQIPRVGGPDQPVTRRLTDAQARRRAAALAESADELTDEERLAEAVRAANEPRKE
jgi:hypothetical protein